MKKIVFSLIVLLLVTLSACAKSPVIIEPLVCTENQIKADEVCVDLTGAEIQIKTSLEHTMELENYRLTTIILEGEMTVEVVSEFAENISKITTPNKIDYFYKNDAVCEHLEISQDVTTQTIIACSENNNALFIKQLEYQWFTIENGKYVVKEEYRSNLEEIFSNAFFDASLQSFDLSVDSGYLSEISMSLLFGTEVIEMTLILDQINQVNITWIGEVS
ncbi:MAG: hypothetical protein KJ847_01065 [Firmicutes bacterium]|nr:hypothetical protein [Bacillota bacterium]